jgi:hypothetical protein
VDGACLIAGPGAPMVSEFCIPEFAAAIGLSHDAGKARSHAGDVVTGGSVGSLSDGYAANQADDLEAAC